MEVDRYLLEPLRSIVEPRGVTVHHADALRAEYAEILQGRDAIVVANLPYNVPRHWYCICSRANR